MPLKRLGKYRDSKLVQFDSLNFQLTLEIWQDLLKPLDEKLLMLHHCQQTFLLNRPRVEPSSEHQ